MAQTIASQQKASQARPDGRGRLAHRRRDALGPRGRGSAAALPGGAHSAAAIVACRDREPAVCGQTTLFVKLTQGRLLGVN